MGLSKLLRNEKLLRHLRLLSHSNVELFGQTVLSRVE